MSVRTRVLKCYIWLVLLYDCESWTLTIAVIKNLEADEMEFNKKMQGILYMAKNTNKQVLIQINQDIFKTIKNGNSNFLDIYIRSKQLEHLAICGKICGMNAQGHPRKMYLDQLKDWLNLNTAGTLQLPHDRKSWKTLTLCLVQVMDLHDDNDDINKLYKTSYPLVKFPRGPADR